MKIRFQPDKETVLRILKTSNIQKKIKILERLNGTNDKDTIRILLKILEDNSWALREKAAYKLVVYGSRVVPRLKNLCRKGHWFTRAAACISLGEIADLNASDTIVKLLLNDNNPTVKKEASKALVKIVRKRPNEFSKYLEDLALDQAQILELLAILETTDPELYGKIKETLGHG